MDSMKNHKRKLNFQKLCSPGQSPIAFLISQMIFFFFITSAGGFLWEVLIFYVKDGRFRNRGFLYGPWLPVYGAGAVLFYLLLGSPLRRITTAEDGFSAEGFHAGRSFFQNRRTQGNAVLTFSDPQKKPRIATLFFLSMLIGTTLELVIGWFLDTVWNLRYWDYSGEPFHFNGYICLTSALGFGIAGVVWIRFLSGFLTKLWLKLPEPVRSGVNTILILVFLIDCTAALIFPNIGTGITFSD